MEDFVRNDKRIFERFNVQLPAGLEKQPKDRCNVVINNISASGVRIIAGEGLEPFEKLSLTIPLSHSTIPVRLNGSVRWTSQEEVGLWNTGIELDKVDLLHIGRLLELTQTI